ncbi:MAG: hypothetical protein ABSF46_33915 [Terriglobia bacterium]
MRVHNRSGLEGILSTQRREEPFADYLWEGLLSPAIGWANPKEFIATRLVRKDK